MKIGDVDISYLDEDGSVLDSESDAISAKKVNEISFFLKYNGILDVDAKATLTVKFYGGWKGALSNEVPLSVLPYSANIQYPHNVYLTSWNYEKGSHYSPGNFRVEVCMGDNILFEKSFILK